MEVSGILLQPEDGTFFLGPNSTGKKNGKRMALSRTYQAPVEVISELWFGFSIAHGIPL